MIIIMMIDSKNNNNTMFTVFKSTFYSLSRPAFLNFWVVTQKFFLFKGILKSINGERERGKCFVFILQDKQLNSII